MKMTAAIAVRLLIAVPLALLVLWILDNPVSPPQASTIGIVALLSLAVAELVVRLFRRTG